MNTNSKTRLYVRFGVATILFISILIAACDETSLAPHSNTDRVSTTMSNRKADPRVQETSAMAAKKILDVRLTKDMSYADLRRILLAEAWVPSADSACKDNVGGEALICDKISELESCSSDGRCVMNFVHGPSAVNLRISTYGEYEDWNVAGLESRLTVSDWSFADARQNAASGKSGLSRNASKATVDNDMPMPAEACTLDGHNEFLESYARNEKTRAIYTASQVQVRDAGNVDELPQMIDKNKYDQFKIGLMDYRWVYLDSAKGENSYERLDVKQRRTGDTLRVDYAEAEFDAEDNIVRTHGEPRAYVFEFKQECWYLTQDLQ